MRPDELKYRFPRASKTFLALNGAELPSAKPKRAPEKPLVKGSKGKAKGVAPVTICYRGFFVRCLDTDNFAGGTKILTDLLRTCQLVPNDDPWSLALSWEQERVKTFAEEKLEIEITYNEVL